MKKIIGITLLTITCISFAANSFLWEEGKISECGNAVYSNKIINVVESVIENINRHETTYTLGLAVLSATKPQICNHKRINEYEQEMKVGLTVRAGTWGEEGDQGEQTSKCFIDLIKDNTGWYPMLLNCEDFSIGAEEL